MKGGEQPHPLLIRNDLWHLALGLRDLAALPCILCRDHKNGHPALAQDSETGALDFAATPEIAMLSTPSLHTSSPANAKIVSHASAPCMPDALPMHSCTTAYVAMCGQPDLGSASGIRTHKADDVIHHTSRAGWEAC